MEVVVATLTDSLHRWLDRGRLALLLLLSLTLAFDTGNYSLLTDCLASVGIYRATLKWLSSFLLGQGQREVLGERMSIRYHLTCAGPWGSPLSDIF